MTEAKKKKDVKKKTAVKKTVAKKVVAKKVTTAKAKPAVKKTATKSKPVVKKAVVKKATATSSPKAKKVVAKKSAPKTTRSSPKGKKTSMAIVPAKQMAMAVVEKKQKAIVPVTDKPKAIVPVNTEQAAEPVSVPARQDKSYQPQVMEKKWQDKWEADQLYRAVIDERKPKHYALTMLPYPSGDLHIGHWFSMIPPDTRARFMRMRGYNVMFPMGFDAFGLPAENAAIKDGIHPMKRTFQNIDRMRTQMRTMGAMFDWKREAISADPRYYKWTEWFFIQLYKAGLAYRKMSAVDWCPNCNTTLAREQVWGDDRHCERCGTPVIKKDLDQWFFKATKYADELLNFEGIDWPERVKTLQTNWIDRSEGASVIFKTEIGNHDVEIFTTRPDTLWGATFMVFSPEHPLVDEITTPENKAAVNEYKLQAARQTDIQRGATDKEKTGVFTGAYAINPVNQARIPIWIADYVMMSYGTGAIMAVPAHDERDFAFARKYELPLFQ